jgi:hypothetical protein
MKISSFSFQTPLAGNSVKERDGARYHEVYHYEFIGGYFTLFGID